MDIFVRQVPVHANEKQLKQFFRPYLAEFGITNFHLNKFRGKPLANITILEATKGNLFLQKYGAGVRSRNLLKINGSFVKCSVSKSIPSDIQLRTLAHETRRQTIRQGSQSQATRLTVSSTANHEIAIFRISSLACGVWTYVNDRLTFQKHFMDQRHGRIVFGIRQAALLMTPNGTSADRLDINYYNVDTVLTGEYSNPTITFTLLCPPKFYRWDATDALAAMMAAQTINGRISPTKTPRKLRLPSIDKNHQETAGTFFVYQAHLTEWKELPKIYQLISQIRNIRSAMSFPTPMRCPALRFGQSMTRLNFDLTDQSRSGSLPFGLRFQVCRLAQNGKLLPNEARWLLPCITRLYRKYGEITTIEAVRRLYLHLVPPGPHTEASEYSNSNLVRLLEKFADSYNSFHADDVYSISNRHAHIILIHKINVTPAGVYLEGPSAEVTNRVLRQYPDRTNYFARVTFMDEDGESVRYDPNSSQDKIYHGRFKTFMDGTYNIAGQGFSFLGFSHSSLRSQTCWFMAPFMHKGVMEYAPAVIRGLGDFSSIMSPARCAARIGQAFTDTTGTVAVDPGMLAIASDIERNGRTFSDGCGTISEGLLKRIWRVYATKRLLKPTILQIRFAGAKGVVSLDSRLGGDQLTLRPSMLKFKGSKANQVEICGASFRPLPMILNRGYIKILEDLGVPIKVFMDLQTAAIENLRMMTSSTINASIFLSQSGTSKTAQLPTLIEHLSDIGLEYRNDTFLRDVVEMAVVTKLRDMKYRGRIPVKNGVTLYGILDETGILEEGQIYVTIEKSPEGGKQVLTGGKVIITRSPAMHPGDIRVVRAVDVPDDSPLAKLSNCVVFSQHGERDLPSQLSGGDLDGDLYNVIFDPKLMPASAIADPADYPRVKPFELDRTVTAEDMSDFFIQFMETDQLGQISTIHLQLSDQHDEGVFHRDCIKLAEMASTAVDFSKTGIPVDMKECPRRDRNRPDFMAPSPRTIIDSGGVNVVQDEDHDVEFENDAFADLDPDDRPMRYYESKKALGFLYRAIDEHQFLRELHNNHRVPDNESSNIMMPKLWDYVKRNNVLVEWEHNRQLARHIKEAYENTLLDLLYEYAPSPHSPLTESEIFAGTILGRAGGASSRRLREITSTMRERFEEILDFTVGRIVHGDADGEDRNDEALPRAMACFAVGMEEGSLVDRKAGGALKSWKYVAAGVCLREMKRWISGGGGSVMLPGL